jgi:osmotically-inducible protein OsmY
MEMTMATLHKYLVWMLVATFLGAMGACAPTAERRGTGEVIDDATLTARVKTALLKVEGIGSFKVDVTTNRGEVQLSGFVRDEDMIRRVVDTTRHVPGVVRVYNDLRLAPRR